MLQDDRPRTIPAPSVVKVAPNLGPESGNTTVTITGDNLEHAIAVHFGGAVAKITKLVSHGEIIVVAPAGTGFINVTVTTPGGTSKATPDDHFSYLPPPVVTKLVPHVGLSAGGTTIVIEGTNLALARAVDFGSASAKISRQISPTEVEVVSPSGVGTVDVVVTTPGGTSAKTAADRFAYASGMPSVTKVSPDNGSVNGGNGVTVMGTNFSSATAVHFGGVAGRITSITSDTELHCVAPAGQGTVNVTVTTPAGTSAKSQADRYSYSITSTTNHPAEIRLLL